MAKARDEALCPINGEVDALVNDLIGRVADKWTWFVLEALEDKGEMRFSRLGDEIQGISQKMLTQTLRAMERDGLVSRKVFPVVPPRVEYKLTELGRSLSYAFCGVWMWAGEHLREVQAARQTFDQRSSLSA